MSDVQVRTYRISRVASATVTEERFERPDPFDLASYWAESIAAYEREAPRLEVTVRVDPEWLGALGDYVGDGAVAAAERLEGNGTAPDPDGWLRLRLRLDWPREVPGHLLGMGAHLEVLDPPEVRDQVKTIAHEVVNAYAARGEAV